MMRPVLLLTLLLLGGLCAPLSAAERLVPAEAGALALAIAGADPGDVLILAPGRHDGPVILDRPVTLDGQGQATIDAGGTGSVVTITGHDITVRDLILTGSGSDHDAIDSGVQITRTASRVLVAGNQILGNLYGVDVHGPRDATVRGNRILGREDHHMNSRGNGVYVWNAPGTVIEDNDIRLGRDGIFVNASNDGIFRRNLMRDLRFAVHYMYANNSEVSGNVSIGNTLGFALMFSNRITVHDNLSLGDRTHGLMLNYANNADIRGNLVRGGAEKCTFIYNAHRNLIYDNRFEGCGIGIHFTAGSERNAITGNAFVANRTQVKYVGTKHVEWSLEGRGNYWSDHPAFDLDGNGVADARFRPNDLMDHILWSQPAASLLMGAPAVQMIRWGQKHFPASLPGGVLDSAPLMRPVTVIVPPHIAAMEAEAMAAARHRKMTDEQFDPLTSH
ncbi:nitrous oxide reductase family maturation protein NosD [Seohaeicola sp. SP36]|jgi:nitrous oxidase accessory protein|uniref:nitrous oxide reductase family maturation protein NosD n=1 Tax=unclassified Seohaeicola TaxID=2641111 RepID=UPI00237B30C1|nr:MULTISPECIES: nitrous oxide reductase family maturation protein NosD [unclassified Seohaeicola]MDD9706730.1 nitrous oxide reductase family maturation protein NosD [Seohaeicola sp. 4SK31]MDD9734436.1 nitrous oxide reductase family maturation protein NosD [Seohaeicola sp. SP36]MDF1706472.1 nitrous oxide reductase family maturation protein NosD [Paracoccaceae bacterium]